MPGILSEFYRFIRDDVRLGALVFPNGKQVLRMEQFNPETGQILLFDELDCIHTAIQDIPVEEFEQTELDENFYKTMQTVRSSEKIRIIHLDNDEKFKALKSWVAGIAEAGMDAFELQAEIEMVHQFAYPITDHLLAFMIRVDSQFMPLFLTKMEQQAMFHGIKHEAYLVSKLLPVFNMLFTDMIMHHGLTVIGRETLKLVLSTEPPDLIFTKNLNYTFLLMYNSEYYKKVLDRNPDLLNLAMKLLITYGLNRANPEFSIFSQEEYANPVFIYLNQMGRNMDVSDPVQAVLLDRHITTFRAILEEIRTKFRDAEYAWILDRLDSWKKKHFE